MRRMVLLLALLAGCSDAEPPAAAKPADPNAPEKSKVISKGQAYSSSDYLVPGYVTVLEAYADW